MLKKIVEWPNKSLKKQAAPIFKIDEETNQLATNLIDTCKIMFGAGLAAPQIGISKRMIVIKPSAFGAENPEPSSINEEYLVMINPSIEVSGENIEWVEACLSVPGTQGKVERSSEANVTYMSIDGETKAFVAQWPFSGALQHEIDHLEGILYIDRQNKKKRWATLYNLKRKRRKQKIQEKRARRMRE